MFDRIDVELTWEEHVLAGHWFNWPQGWVAPWSPERVELIHRLNRRYVDGKDPGLPERVKRAFGLLPHAGTNRR